MTTHRHWRSTAAGAAAVAVFAAAASGCNGLSQATENGPAETKAPASPSPTVTQSSEDRAIAAAKPVIRDYFAVYEAVAKRPAIGPTRYETIAEGQELRDLRTEWRLFRERGVHVEGTGRIHELTITHADVENDPAVVEADVCFDVSEAELVDSKGNIVTPKGREDQSLRRMRLTNDNWPEGRWMVSWTESKGQACA